ncbi:permease-like cell division protein FtsX [Thorsellia kenyensis]|uniref:Cell division protein FtsX n=1 Tax=Thorsellia kenyensis TaxID=1549888 RepID=A0ABV6C6Q8_9GAMM
MKAIKKKNVKNGPNRSHSRISLMESGMFEQFRFGWISALDDLKRKPFANILTICVIAISISLPTLCYLIWKNVNEAASVWYPTPQISVYLDKSLSDSAVNKLITDLKALEGVSEVIYLTREETLAEFKNYSGFSTALDLLEENPLPAVAIVTPQVDFDAGQSLRTLIERMSKLNGVDDVRADDNWFSRLASLTDLVGSISLLVGTLMVIALLLVISNSIRLTISMRKDAINIMKLIGATDGFIMRPFLYAGLLFGFSGAFLAVLLSQILMFFLSQSVSSVASVFETEFDLTGLRFDEMLIIILVCAMCGWFSAWLTTVKHLRHFNPE